MKTDIREISNGRVILTLDSETAEERRLLSILSSENACMVARGTDIGMGEEEPIVRIQFESGGRNKLNSEEEVNSGH